MPPSPSDPVRKLRISTIIVERIEGHQRWQDIQAELEQRSPTNPGAVDGGNIGRLAENSAPSRSSAPAWGRGKSTPSQGREVFIQLAVVARSSSPAGLLALGLLS